MRSSTAVPSHDVEDEPSGAFPVVRPTLLSRTAREHARQLSAADFDRACIAAGVTNGQIARAWGVDEAIVRRVRSGKARLDLPLIKALPASVRAPLARALLPDVDPRDERIENHVVVLLDLVRSRRGM